MCERHLRVILMDLFVCSFLHIDPIMQRNLKRVVGFFMFYVLTYIKYYTMYYAIEESKTISLYVYRLCRSTILNEEPIYCTRRGGRMGRAQASHTGDREFNSQSNQTNDIKD